MGGWKRPPKLGFFFKKPKVLAEAPRSYRKLPEASEGKYCPRKLIVKNICNGEHTRAKIALVSLSLRIFATGSIRGQILPL